MQQAVAMVKADFGDDAVILHTKRFRRGGFFGLFGTPKVEVIAAVEPGKTRKRPARPKRQQVQLEQAHEMTAVALKTLQDEVRSLKQLIGEQQRHVDAMPEGVRAAFDRLRVRKFLRLTATSCWSKRRAMQSRPSLTMPKQCGNGWWPRSAAQIDTVPPWQFDKKPVIVPLVGPTGVGKTTTIAKLAANFSILAGANVGLVTADTYRIAAVQQLRTYAGIIGIDLLVAYTPDELKEAVDQLADKDLILIDTAGRSQNNIMHMGELRSFLEVLPDPEVHLVLSATTRLQDMLDVADRFAETGFDRLIMTKIDETSFFGALYQLPRLLGKPLSYLTSGQSVPDDISVASNEKVARLIMGDPP